MDFEYMRSTDMVHKQATDEIPLYRIRVQEQQEVHILLPRPHLTSLKTGNNAAFIVAPEDQANLQDFQLPRIPRRSRAIQRIKQAVRAPAVQQQQPPQQAPAPTIAAAKEQEAGAANQPDQTDAGAANQQEEVQAGAANQLQAESEEQLVRIGEHESARLAARSQDEEVIIIVDDDQEQRPIPTERDDREEVTEAQQESKEDKEQGDIQMAETDDEIESDLTLGEMKKQIHAARPKKKRDQRANAPTHVREQVEADPTNIVARQTEDAAMDPKAGETGVNDPKIADMGLCVPQGHPSEDEAADSKTESQPENIMPSPITTTYNQEQDITTAARHKDDLARKRIKKLKTRVAKLTKRNKENRALIRDLRTRVQQLEENSRTEVTTTQQQQTTPPLQQEQDAAHAHTHQTMLTYQRGAHKRKERSGDNQTETDFRTSEDIQEEENLLQQAPKRIRHLAEVELDQTENSAAKESEPEDDPSKYPIFPNHIMGTNQNAETAASSWANMGMITLKMPGSVRPGSPGTLPDVIPANAYWQDIVAPATAEKPFLKMVEYAKAYAAERIPAAVYYQHQALLKALEELKRGKPSEWFTDDDHTLP